MKYLLVLFLLFGCNMEVKDLPVSCNGYSDLCWGSPANVHYELCSDSAGTWWVVNGIEYYTVDYMFDQECD